jgi:predicted nucleic acid-binding protein
LSFLLDTNVISQPTKTIPNASAIRWLDGIRQSELFLSVITIQEIRTGVELLPVGKRRQALDAWVTKDLTSRFAGNILPVDEETADRCGYLVAATKKKGHTPELSDVLIAATAIVHGLTLVTLNGKHFEMFPVTLFTP